MVKRVNENCANMINTQTQRERAPRNRTISLSDEELTQYRNRLITLIAPASVEAITDVTIHQDFFEASKHLPAKFVDLLVVDPPYNLDKRFNSTSFRSMEDESYEKWVDSWLVSLFPILKETASIYVCCDWRSTAAVYRAIARYFIVRNRITWEREKGRGAAHNWKNCSEDIWFATVSDRFTFRPEAVKLKRKVIAPYRDDEGKPKDWVEDSIGNYRLTHPSNLWTDLTVPFWSMSENTDHPTQKPEKLLAKMILASSCERDFVFDPFLGSGTTSVVAKKLRRHYCGVEIDKTYACLTEKRLGLAQSDVTIQGYADGVFWERNTFNQQVDRVRIRGKEHLGSTPLMDSIWSEAK